MFQAVRKWWRSARGKTTRRLFAFELVVVMIGVFAAQQVSNWADRRAALEQVERVHRNLYYSYDFYRAIAGANRVAIQCLSKRLDIIMERASVAGGSGDAALSRPVILMKMAPDSISPDSEQLLRERYGDAVADTMGSIQFNLRAAERSGTNIEQRWFEFERLNRQHGPVSDADRSAVRETAVKLYGDLFALRRSSDLLLHQIAKLDVPHSSRVAIAPVASCDAMWKSGKGFDEAR